MKTTVTFRTDEQLKNQATELFNNLGLSLSAALNIFMKQAVLKKRYPCSLEVDDVTDARKTYPEGFFELFGTGSDLGLDEEPEDKAEAWRVVL